MDTPLVSVVVPCYNHEKYVQECIQSIIDQDYQNIELIIIDDGSQDGSVDKIQEMANSCKKRFKRFEFRYRSNRGLCATLNEGVGIADGKYIAPIASDDVWLANKTSYQVNVLEIDDDVSVVSGGCMYINDNSLVVGELCRDRRYYAFDDFFLRKVSIVAPSVLIRTSALKQVGCWSSEFLVEDYYLWLRLSEKYKILNLGRVFCLYRRHSNNVSKNYMDMLDNRLKIIGRYRGHLNYEKSVKLNILAAASHAVVHSKFQAFRLLMLSGIPISLSYIKVLVKLFLPRRAFLE